MRNSKITILVKIVVFIAIFAIIVTGLNAFVEPSTLYPWQMLPFIYQRHDIDSVDLSTVTEPQCWLMAETRQAGTLGEAVHRTRSLYELPMQ